MEEKSINPSKTFYRQKENKLSFKSSSDVNVHAWGSFSSCVSDNKLNKDETIMPNDAYFRLNQSNSHAATGSQLTNDLTSRDAITDCPGSPEFTEYSDLEASLDSITRLSKAQVPTLKQFELVPATKFCGPISPSSILANSPASELKQLISHNYRESEIPVNKVQNDDTLYQASCETTFTRDTPVLQISTMKDGFPFLPSPNNTFSSNTSSPTVFSGYGCPNLSPGQPTLVSESKPKSKYKSSHCGPCSNCKTHDSPLWRKATPPNTGYWCNACGLFFKNHKKLRDPAMERRRNKRNSAKDKSRKVRMAKLAEMEGPAPVRETKELNHFWQSYNHLLNLVPCNKTESAPESKDEGALPMDYNKRECSLSGSEKQMFEPFAPYYGPQAPHFKSDSACVLYAPTLLPNESHSEYQNRPAPCYPQTCTSRGSNIPNSCATAVDERTGLYYYSQSPPKAENRAFSTVNRGEFCIQDQIKDTYRGNADDVMQIPVFASGNRELGPPLAQVNTVPTKHFNAATSFPTPAGSVLPAYSRQAQISSACSKQFEHASVSDKVPRGDSGQRQLKSLDMWQQLEKSVSLLNATASLVQNSSRLDNFTNYACSRSWNKTFTNPTEPCGFRNQPGNYALKQVEPISKRMCLSPKSAQDVASDMTSLHSGSLGHPNYMKQGFPENSQGPTFASSGFPSSYRHELSAVPHSRSDAELLAHLRNLNRTDESGIVYNNDAEFSLQGNSYFASYNNENRIADASSLPWH